MKQNVNLHTSAIKIDGSDNNYINTVKIHKTRFEVLQTLSGLEHHCKEIIWQENAAIQHCSECENFDCVVIKVLSHWLSESTVRKK